MNGQRMKRYAVGLMLLFMMMLGNKTDIWADVTIPDGTYTVDQIKAMGNYPYIINGTVNISSGGQTLDGSLQPVVDRPVFELKDGAVVTVDNTIIENFSSIIFYTEGGNVSLKLGEGTKIRNNKNLETQQFHYESGCAVTVSFLGSLAGTVSVAMDGAEISNNKDTNGNGHGAGLFVQKRTYAVIEEFKNSQIKVNINNTKFNGNEAYCGGAIHTTSANIVEYSITKSHFEGNKAISTTNPDSASYGGAIYNQNYKMDISDTEFIDNHADQGLGGAVFSSYTAIPNFNPPSQEVTMTNCNVNSNHAYYQAGMAISNQKLTLDGEINFKNNISAPEFSGALSTLKVGGLQIMTGAASLETKAGSTITFSGNEALGGKGNGGLSLQNCHEVTLDGTITLKNNKGVYGGGLFSRVASSYTLDLLGTITASNNEATKLGGGMCLILGNNLTSIPTKLTVEGNTAEDGGGIYTQGNYNFYLGGTTSVSNNTAKASGGSVYDYEQYGDPSDADLNYYGGGGIYSNGTPITMTGTVKVEGNTLTNGVAASGGAGILLNKEKAKLTATGSGVEISNNTVTSGQGSGAGIFDNDAIMTLTGITINKNTTNGRGNGGGIYLTKVMDSASKRNLTTTDCLINENEAVIGGGIYIAGNCLYSTLYQTMTITGGELNGNRTLTRIAGTNMDEDGNGAAIYANTVNMAFTQGSIGDTNHYPVFKDNQAVKDGGAVRLVSCANASDITASFLHNSANRNGGAISIKGTPEIDDNKKALIFTDCTVKYNLADSGGGIHIAEDADVKMTSSNSGTVTIEKNGVRVGTEETGGGGLYIENHNCRISGQVLIDQNYANVTAISDAGAVTFKNEGTTSNSNNNTYLDTEEAYLSVYGNLYEGTKIGITTSVEETFLDKNGRPCVAPAGGTLNDTRLRYFSYDRQGRDGKPRSSPDNKLKTNKTSRKYILWGNEFGETSSDMFVLGQDYTIIYKYKNSSGADAGTDDIPGDVLMPGAATDEVTCTVIYANNGTSLGTKTTLSDVANVKLVKDPRMANPETSEPGWKWDWKDTSKDWKGWNMKGDFTGTSVYGRNSGLTSLILDETGNKDIPINEGSFITTDGDVTFYGIWQYVTVLFSFTKVDADKLSQYINGEITEFADVSRLAGAKFKLYQYTGSESEPADVVELPGTDWTLIGSEVTSDENGKVDFGELAVGTYRMVETNAPESYVTPKGQWQVKLEGGETAKVTVTPITPITDPEKTVPEFYTDEDSSALFVGNEKKSTFPFSFTKVDADKLSQYIKGELTGFDDVDRLAGAIFKLYQYTGSGDVPEGIADVTGTDWTLVDGSPKTSDDKGKVDFGELAAGTYRMVETNAPESYVTPEGQWQVELGEEETPQVTAIPAAGKTMPQFYTDEAQENALIVGNEPDKTTDLTFTKVDVTENGENGAAQTNLPGAKFKLYAFTCTNTDESHEHDAYATGEEGSCYTALQDDEGNDLEMVSGEDGVVSFTSLKTGTYMLVETQAPEGYHTPRGQWKITVDAKQAAPKDQIAIEAVTAYGEKPTAFIKTETGNEASYKLTNMKPLQLPVTGNPSFMVFMVACALLVSTSSLGMLVQLRGGAAGAAILGSIGAICCPPGRKMRLKQYLKRLISGGKTIRFNIYSGLCRIWESMRSMRKK